MLEPAKARHFAFSLAFSKTVWTHVTQDSSGVITIGVTRFEVLLFSFGCMLHTFAHYLDVNLFLLHIHSSNTSANVVCVETLE